jgi:hypothetical protein
VKKKGIIKLKMLLCIILYKLDSKLDAIINENGGPKTTQHRNAIKQSVSINNFNLSLRVRFFKVFPMVLERIFKPYVVSWYCIPSLADSKDKFIFLNCRAFYKNIYKFLK